MQQAKALHASGQLTDAELETMRIKIAVQEEWDNLQANGQVAQEKIERVLAEEATKAEAQRLGLPKGNEQEAKSPENPLQKLLFFNRCAVKQSRKK